MYLAGVSFKIIFFFVQYRSRKDQLFIIIKILECLGDCGKSVFRDIQMQSGDKECDEESLIISLPTISPLRAEVYGDGTWKCFGGPHGNLEIPAFLLKSGTYISPPTNVDTVWSV